jgi:hypothetical protein
MRVAPQPWWSKLLHWMFPQQYPQGDDIFDLEGYAEGFVNIECCTHVDFRDRLRLLISGKVTQRILVKTDVVVGKVMSISTFSVMPPNASM